MTQPATPIHRCPQCDGIGQPFQVDTTASGVLVSLRCPYCGGTWKESRHTAPPGPGKGIHSTPDV